MTGKTKDGRIETVQIVPDGSPVANYAFDVTPARLVTGLITERGVSSGRTAQRWPRPFPSAPKSMLRSRHERSPPNSRWKCPSTAASRRPRWRSRAAPRGCCTRTASAW